LSLPVHVPETLYRCRKLDNRPTGQQIFDYHDPRHRTAQEEMELIATEHLKRIGAYLSPKFARPKLNRNDFPVQASVVIPVRNRARTIADAVQSALSQEAPFPFNVIVVDNHSTDGTTDILRQLASQNDRLVHLVPERTDLGIGGCWNHAVQSRQCGRVAVQLDSDDIYSGPDTLRQVVEKVDEGPYAMVVGSYRMVNFELKDIPPGLIDHREWTRENGRNNLLRVNGLGAPRAFLTEILRQHPLPNVSYGEDYCIGLRLSRHYEIGRIFESVYLCRRWEGNTDANLPLASKNAHDTYKDRLRTLEILARQHVNLNGGPGHE
jgi:glycosyltransferase involved in cell wall biosynthesis